MHHLDFLEPHELDLLDQYLCTWCGEQETRLGVRRTLRQDHLLRSLSTGSLPTPSQSGTTHLMGPVGPPRSRRDVVRGP